MTGSDFEFLIAPGDVDIKAEDFDSIMTPDTFKWEKEIKNDQAYYKVGDDRYSYSWEIPGIQMMFNSDIAYEKAKLIADEIVKKLTKYSGQEIELIFISTNNVVRFDLK